MPSQCELCGDEADLRDSHVIPRFVFKHLKKTGATPFLRKVVEPDERFQDHKEQLLCAKCEQHLNRFESPFAGYIYHPYQRGEKTVFQYDDWLYHFILSVNWRLIISKLSRWEDLPSYAQEAVTDAKEIWFEILQGGTPIDHDPHTHHMVLLSDLNFRTDSAELPEKWEFYLDRSIDATVVHGVGIHYFFKFPGLAFISCIQPPEVTGFRNTEIQHTGKIGVPQRIPRDWENFLITRAGRAFDYEPSESSQDRITEWIMERQEREERAIQSESFRVWDESMQRRIENHDPTDYLDQECPVCFTNHRVIESLPKRPLKQSEAEQWGKGYDFFEPIYLRDELEHPDAPTDITPTIVFSTEERTVQIALYSDEGWVVEKEIDLLDEMDPEKMGEKLREATYEEYVEFAEEHR